MQARSLLWMYSAVNSRRWDSKRKTNACGAFACYNAAVIFNKMITSWWPCETVTQIESSAERGFIYLLILFTTRACCCSVQPPSSSTWETAGPVITELHCQLQQATTPSAYTFIYAVCVLLGLGKPSIGPRPACIVQAV